jgi:inner membrane protein
MSLLGHVAIGVVAGRGVTDVRGDGEALVGRLVGFSALALLPDSDLILGALMPGVGLFEHRGPSHSLVVAAVVAIVAAFILTAAGQSHPGRWAGLVFVVVASHGLVDTLGQSDLGVQLLWPFSDARILAPWHILPNPALEHPLERAFVTPLVAEALLYLPAWLYAFTPRSWIAGLRDRLAAR